MSVRCAVFGHRWSKTPCMYGNGSGLMGQRCCRCGDVEWENER